MEAYESICAVVVVVLGVALFIQEILRPKSKNRKARSEMSRKQIWEYRCNVCGSKITVHGGYGLSFPDGRIDLTLLGSVDDHICVGCLNRLAVAKKNGESPCPSK